jgi:hypothetical protein
MKTDVLFRNHLKPLTNKFILKSTQRPPRAKMLERLQKIYNYEVQTSIENGIREKETGRLKEEGDKVLKFSPYRVS